MAARSLLAGLLMWLPAPVLAAPPEPALGEPTAAEAEAESESEGEAEDGESDEHAPEPVELAKPKWIKHTIIPGELIGDIAARYHVSTKSLIRWNKLDADAPKIYAGRKLSVYTKHVPPPRRKLIYTVESGDTWSGVAKAHHVDADTLRTRWNPKVPRKFKVGQKLVIWVDPLDDPAFGERRPGSGGAAIEQLPLVKVPSGSISVGKPSKGRLVSSAQLPENRQLYSIRKPDEAYGSSHTLHNLQLAIARWRRDSGFAGALKIGSISKQGGGKLEPHSSHRSGRDVDIRLPVKHKGGSAEDVREVDWDALWTLIVALVDTGEVETIYLTSGRQKHLYAAAKRAGASKATIERVLQYPETRGRNNGIVRHSKGHTAHIHVRFACADNETRCENN